MSDQVFPLAPCSKDVPQFPPMKVAPNHAAPYAELAASLAMLVAWVVINSFSTGLIGTKTPGRKYQRVTKHLENTKPDDVPDLGWSLVRSLGAGAFGPVVTIATFPPIFAIGFALFYVACTQRLNWTVTLINAYVVLMAIRTISILVTYHPRLNTCEEQNSEVLGMKHQRRFNSGFSIDPSGHTIAIVFPLFFLALATTDAGTEERELALCAAAFVALIPVCLVWYSHMHHTSSTVVSVGLSVLMAYAATENMVGWQPVVIIVVLALVLLLVNLATFGIPKVWGASLS